MSMLVRDSDTMANPKWPQFSRKEQAVYDELVKPAHSVWNPALASQVLESQFYIWDVCARSVHHGTPLLERPHILSIMNGHFDLMEMRILYLIRRIMMKWGKLK